MAVKDTIVGWILNYIIQILREIRDRYLGNDHADTKIQPNKRTKKKFDSWIRNNVKKSKRIEA